jgi:MFS family permease
VTVAPGWFGARRGLAMGVVLSGTGVGGVLWAPLLRALNASMGFRGALRLVGAVGFVLIVGAAAVLRWDPESEKRWAMERRRRRNGRGADVGIPLVNWQIVRSRKFAAQALGALLQAAAYYTPIYFFSAYSRLLGYSSAAGANFISASNGASALGKVFLGYIADRYGRLNTLLVCTILSAIATLGLWLPSTMSVEEEKAKVLFGVFSIFYGIFAGAYVSLFPTALVELFGVQSFSSVNGFLYMLRGVGSLVGTPAAGALLRGGSEPSLVLGYEKLSSMVGTLMAGAAIAMFWVRVESTGIHAWKWRV